MGVPSQAPTIVLDYNPSTKKYEKTVTDTNNVLSSFNFSISGVTLSRNGNTLSISTANKITAGTVASSTKPPPAPASTGILIWQSVNNPSGNQNMITGGGAGDPVPAYLSWLAVRALSKLEKPTLLTAAFSPGPFMAFMIATVQRLTSLPPQRPITSKASPSPWAIIITRN